MVKIEHFHRNQRKGVYKMPDLLFSVFQNDRFMDLTIYQYGYEKCRSMHSFGPGVRNHYLFHYVISGKGTLRANDKEDHSSDHVLSGGLGFLIEPGYVNHYWADKADPWEYIWVEFGGMRAREFVEAAGLSYANPVYHPDTPENGLRLLREMTAIVNSDESSYLSSIGHMYLFMDCLTKTSQSRKQMQGGRISEFYAREAVHFIEQHYQENITVEELAKFCRLDRSYFGKVFKSEMGQSPQEFLIRYRMEKAAELLVLTNSSVGDIGAAVGYNNSLHFSRAFKGIHGMSPREYRQQYKLIKRNNKAKKQ